MSKKNIALLFVLLIMGAIYIVYFTGMFQESKMEITSRVRPPLPSRRPRGKIPPPAGKVISFSLNNKYSLTRLRVVEENDWETNKYPHPLWQLISESNSVPTKAIFYGVPVAGMKPEYEKAKAEPLRTNVPYLLLLEAGKIKGQLRFQVR